MHRCPEANGLASGRGGEATCGLLVGEDQRRGTVADQRAVRPL